MVRKHHKRARVAAILTAASTIIGVGTAARPASASALFFCYPEYKTIPASQLGNYDVIRVLNTWVKRSTQLFPHDGVAALALSSPAAPAPPARTSAAATAKTLLLIDIGCSLLHGAAVPRARLTCASLLKVIRSTQ